MFIQLKQYARACWEVLRNAPPEKIDELLKNFFAMLRARGHQHLLPRIARQIEEYQRKDIFSRTVRIISATPLTAAEKDEILNRGQTKSFFEIPNRVIVFSENSDLLGGYTIQSDNAFFDESYKTKLISLHKRMIGA